ncbi:MAG: glycosyltransferase family 9 protein [Streptosporangiales bacterium]|nr:glycosyltransferase family 9 protein [Streptosporangiales bacterium]
MSSRSAGRGPGRGPGRRRHVLVARLDSFGDVLLAGPAIRAVAAHTEEVTLLAGPVGHPAGELLPGVSRIVEWAAPWIEADPDPVDRAHVERLTKVVADAAPDAAVVLTSYHQSALPTALLLRLAGVPWIAAISEDYPGSLLDVRHRVDEELPEAERGLSLARAAGYSLPADDDGRLRVRTPLPDVPAPAGEPGYVVLHPGTSVPARAWPADRFVQAARDLHAAGHRVVVTGGAGERSLTGKVAGQCAVDLGGRTSPAELAAVLAGAAAAVVGNTGPAHLAAAVGCPVVSLFAPTLPARRWAPYRVPTILLGDQQAPCRDSRARECPVPGHPCLTTVTSADVVAAVDRLTQAPRWAREPPRGLR